MNDLPLIVQDKENVCKTSFSRHSQGFIWEGGREGGGTLIARISHPFDIEICQSHKEGEVRSKMMVVG